MNQIDEIAHLIQLSVAPVFLLTGVGTLLNVLSADIRQSSCFQADRRSGVRFELSSITTPIHGAP